MLLMVQVVLGRGLECACPSLTLLVSCVFLLCVSSQLSNGPVKAAMMPSHSGSLYSMSHSLFDVPYNVALVHGFRTCGTQMF
jgi:hypothetical protein